MGIFTPCKKLWSVRIYPTLEKGFILFLQKIPPVHVLICQNKFKKLVPNGTTAAASQPYAEAAACTPSHTRSLQYCTQTHTNAVCGMWIMGPHIYHQEEHVKKCSLLAVSAKATNRAAGRQWDIHPLIINIKLPKSWKHYLVFHAQACVIWALLYMASGHMILDPYSTTSHTRLRLEWNKHHHHHPQVPSAPMDGTFNWFLLLWMNTANWTHLTSVVNDNYLCHFFLCGVASNATSITKIRAHVMRSSIRWSPFQ